jgi:hypothetical protein
VPNKPILPAKNVTGDFDNFTDFMRDLWPCRTLKSRPNSNRRRERKSERKSERLNLPLPAILAQSLSFPFLPSCLLARHRSVAFLRCDSSQK